VAGVVAGLAGLLSNGRWLLLVGSPLALALARPTDRPTLAWLAVALLVADLLLGGEDVSEPPTA
jgi:hypothetical protein